MMSYLTTAKAMFIACISILVFTHQLSAQTFKLVGTGKHEGGSVYALDANGANPERWVDFTEGTRPRYGSLVEVDGNLWGMTQRGGTHDLGTIYRINNDGTGYKKIYDFKGLDGEQPHAGLSLANGKLWGMTNSGGAHGVGAIFYLETDGTGFTKVHDFENYDPTNGIWPYGKLIESNGKLWGMTYAGGASGNGTIFTLESDGTGFILVHSFNNTDGNLPFGNLVDNGGTLWGMTNQGGTDGKGVIFKIENNGTGFTKVYDFDGSNGENPYGSLTVSNGKLWGLTYTGGSSNWGVIFNMDTDGTNFSIVKEITDSYDGRFMYGDLFEYNNKLYGTSTDGGTYGKGTVYSINNDGTNYSIISSVTGYGFSDPESSLVFSNGKLWGYSRAGSGTIFNLNPDGSDLQVIHDFELKVGYDPTGRLVESNEKLWGTTSQLSSLPPRIFTTNIDGTGFEIVHNFSTEYDGDGSDPGPLVAIGDQLWGMCKTGGKGSGTIFYINYDGTGFTKVHDFDNENGGTPYGTLIESNGKIWGMTYQGGVNGEGLIFSINADGTGYTIVHSFDDTNGANPYGELYESGGKFWGLTHHGGTQDFGVIFSIEVDGTGFIKHHDINDLPNSAGPNGSFIEANGKLWATIENGGIVSMNTDGTGLLQEHQISTGELLYGNLMHFNNKLWGVTYAPQAGTIFTLDDDGTNFTEVRQMDPSFGAQLYYAYGAALIAVDQNHRPTYSDIPTQEYKEDETGKQVKLTDYFDDIEDGPSGLTYTVENITEPSLFASTPIAAGTLSLNLAANKFGSTEITIRGTDTGGKFIEGTFTINISPVADDPTITSSSTSYGVKTTDGLVAARNTVDGNEVNYVRVTDITNGTLYLSNGSTKVNNNSFVTFSNALNGFKFTPTDVGVASFNIQASIGNTVAGLGGSTVKATISVAKKTLNASANNKTRIYGANNPTLTITYSGFVLGENAAVLNTPPLASTSAIKTSNVGNYTISLSQGSDDHYDIIEAIGMLAITKAPLLATADNKTKKYREVNPALTITYSGFANGENSAVLDTAPNSSTSATTNSNAGDYSITLSAATDNNYDITLKFGTLTISKRTITAKADDNSKVYGEVNPTFTITYTGFLSGENENNLDTPPVASSMATAFSDVGNYPISLTAATDNNYLVETINGILSVTKAPLTAIGDDKTKMYGESIPMLTISYQGLLNGDSPALIDNPPVPSTSATELSIRGTYAISLSSGSDNNYIISNVNGTLTITKALLMAKAENKSKIYGAINPELTILYEGFANGDDASSLDVIPTVSTSVIENTLVGEYPISITSATDNNYDIEVESGTFFVEKALLKATIENAGKIYGEANPTFGIQYSGFLFDDDELTLDNYLIATTTAEEKSDVGSYSIYIDETTDSNYEIEVTEGTLTVHKANLKATAENKIRFYKEENPGFTISYEGFVVGDNEDMLDEIPSLDSDADMNSDVGVYTISVTGGSDNNYNILLADGQLTIDKANQMITFEELPDVSLEVGSIILEASVSSGLPVSYSLSDNTIATISDNIVSLLSLGEVTITASQEGNSNYNPAESVARTLTISEITGIENEETLSISIYPNPASDYFSLHLENPPIGNVKLVDQEGKLIREFEYSTHAEYDIRSLNNGMYLILLETEVNKAEVKKFLINKR